MNGNHWVRPLLYAICGAGVGFVVVLLAWLLVTVYQVTGQIKATQQVLAAQAAYAADCQEPGGKCFAAKEARDAEQVGAFNAAVIAAAWCIKQDPPTRRALTICVGKILDGKEHP